MDFGDVRRLGARLASTIVRGVVSRINDATGLQQLQITLRFDDVADRIEHFQPFGLSFHPTAGSECLVLSVGASQDNLVAVAVSDRDYRPTDIEEGEGGLYSTDGWRFFCKSDGTTHLGVKEGTQSYLRGEDVRDALKTYADDVTSAVNQMDVVAHKLVKTATVLALFEAANKLQSSITAALSTKVKSE